MNKIFSALITHLLLLFAVGGCTRLEVQPTKFTFAIPQKQQLMSKSAQSTTGLLRHVVINVRGTGITNPISMNFDANSRDPMQPLELPSSYTIEIPSGSSRFIQVLAVYSETSSKNSAFFYGDSTINLNGGEVVLDIPMSLYGGGSTRSGKVSGRYYATDGSTPSGRVESRFAPATGKPSMIINKSSMTSGWFNAFALEDVPMDIVLADKEETIFAGVRLDSFPIQDNKTMKITVPPFYQTYGGGSGGENREGTTVVLGFFGPGVPAGHKVCYTASSYTYTNLFKDSTKTAPLSWDASSTNSQNVTATKHASVETCLGTDAALAFNSVFPFNPSLFNNWGGEEALGGFYGVFRFPTNSNQGSAPVAVSFDSSGQFTSQFSVLPGMPNVFDSIGIYYRAQNSPRDYENGDEAPCAAIALGGFGFSRIASIPLVAGTLDYSVSKPSPPDISMNAAFAYCPLKNNVAIGGGFINSHPWSSNVGGGGGMGPAVEANSFQSHLMGQIGVNQCHRIHVYLVNESNGTFNTNVTNSTTRSFSVNNTMGLNFYSNESSCIGELSPISTFSIPANSNNSELWIRSGASTITGIVTVQSPSSFGASIAKTMNLSVTYPDPPSKIQGMRDQIFLGSNGCETLELTAYDFNWTPSPFGSMTSVQLYKYDLNDIVTDESFNFYSDCASTTPISTVAFNAGAFKTTFAVKANGTPSSNRRIHISEYGPVDIYLNITPVADHVSVNFNNGRPVYAGECVPVTLRAEDNINNQITSANFAVQVMSYHPTAPGYYGKFKSYCSSPSEALSPFLLSSGTASLNYYAENPTTGLQFETRSIFANQVRQKELTILPAPPLLRTTSIKVHLTSDSATPNMTSSGFWPSPSLGGVYLNSPQVYFEVGSGANPKTDGVLFSTATAQLAGPLNVQPSDNIALTARFKITSPGEATVLGLGSSTSGNYQSVATGTQHTCGIINDGRLKCWGGNSFGQIGDGTNATKSTLTEIDSPTLYTKIAAGGNHTCGITTSGTLKCWGQNSYGQLGDGTTVHKTTPVILDSGTSYAFISAGTFHTCGIIISGALKCWGDNTSGQLGDGTTIGKNAPVIIDSGTSYAAVTTGLYHTCGITSAGQLKCWGKNVYGQLGDGTTNDSLAPVSIDIGNTYINISISAQSSCGVNNSGVLKCWGENTMGQLGDGSTTTRLSPTVIDSGTQYNFVDIGTSSTCAGTSAGQLKCWGNNDNGKLGDGTLVNKNQPTLVNTPGTSFASVNVGQYHACGITTSNNLKCWGANSDAQLGLGDTLSRSTPKTVDDQDFKIFTEVVDGSLKLKGSGGWEYASSLNLNTWYTVTLTRQGSNISAFVNGAAAGSSATFTPSQGTYNAFKVGTGFVGALKAVLIDADATTATGIGATDHSYLQNRVP